MITFTCGVSAAVSTPLNFLCKQKKSVQLKIWATQKNQYQPSSPDNNPQISRPTANFHPSIWGDQFLNYHHSSHIINKDHQQKEIEELKGVVRRELLTSSKGGGGVGDYNNISHQLKLIDAMERLGVAYHFETEIQEALERIHSTYIYDHQNHHSHDLYHVSLAFRLLRQHRHNISSDIFNKFKDENGDFKESLVYQESGMLSFYEATHVRVRGEDVLDEGLLFITDQLECSARNVIRSSMAAKEEEINQALERPLLKCLPRLGARHYMSIYQHEASHNEDLLKLAKLDFNMLQSLHKNELSDIIKWWKELEFDRTLPFARDRIVELYFWAVAVYFEPQYSDARKILTKVMALWTVMDDIYDAFGTFDELQKFTEAITRWDVNCKDELPDYMQLFYEELLNLLNKIEEELAKEGRTYRVYYAKEAWKAIAQAYFEEARWVEKGCIPSMEEYMHVATASIGNNLLSTICLLGMGDIVSNETFEWLSTNPKILRASNVIFRLMNDIAGYKFDKERGHVAGSIDCYMKQYGVSEEETINVLNKQVENMWKDVNQELLSQTDVPMPVLTRILNLTRIVDLLYKNGDGFTHVGQHITDIITSLFINPVPF